MTNSIATSFSASFVCAMAMVANASGQPSSAPVTDSDTVMSSDAPPPPVSPPNRIVSQAKQVAEHLEPAIPRPEQERAAAEKLAAFEKRTGRKPNILLLLVDDLG